jgi:hypothetical protein
VIAIVVLLTALIGQITPDRLIRAADEPRNLADVFRYLLRAAIQHPLADRPVECEIASIEMAASEPGCGSVGISAAGR